MLTPFVKPCIVLNLAVRNVFMVNPPDMQSRRCFLKVQNNLITSMKCPKKSLRSIRLLLYGQSGIDLNKCQSKHVLTTA